MVKIEDFAKIELKIAEILEAAEHPNADRLLVLKIKIGEEERSLVAGIKSHYAPEELPGKKIVVVANLEPATIRGVESQGMLLAASDDDQLTLVVPEKEITSGARIK